MVPALIALALLAEPPLAATSTAGPSVLLFPIEPGRGVGSASAYQASRTLVGVLEELSGDTPVEPVAKPSAKDTKPRPPPKFRLRRALKISKETGLDLRREASQCREQLACLVQLGRAVRGDLMLLGSLKKQKNADNLILKFLLLDVPRSKFVDSIVWALPNDPEAIRTSVRAAAMHLFQVPNTRVTVDLEPTDARLFLYGELFGTPPYEKSEEIPFWAGTYHGRVERPGYVEKEIRVVIPEGKTKVSVTLEADPLWREAPKERAVRLTDSIVLAAEEGEAEIEEPRSKFANLYGWLGVAAGVGVTTLGGVVLVGAQNDYNAVSGEIRYTRDRTRTAYEAIEVRDDANARHKLGLGVAVSGLVLAGVSFGLMLFSEEPEVEEP